MKRYLCGLLAMGLLAAVTGRAMAQPSYRFTTIELPDLAVYTWAIGINDSGQIVGRSLLGGFLLDQGSYTTLDVPGSTFSDANGINASGQIVGWYDGGGFLAIPLP